MNEEEKNINNEQEHHHEEDEGEGQGHEYSESQSQTEAGTEKSSSSVIMWTVLVIVVAAVVLLFVFSGSNTGKGPSATSTATSSNPANPAIADLTSVVAQLDSPASGYEVSDYSFIVLPREPFESWTGSLSTQQKGDGPLLFEREELSGGYAAFGDLSKEDGSFRQNIRGVTETQEFAACFLRQEEPDLYSFRGCATVAAEGAATTTLRLSDSSSGASTSCSPANCEDLSLPFE